MSLRSSVVIATVLYAAAAASAQVSTPQEPAARPAPAAPAGEVAATPDAETDLGGNPAPVPTERYWLEQGLDRLGVGELPFRVYGWSQVSYTASSTDRFNTPTTFNDRAESFQLQQNWLEVVRSIDTSRAETQYGFRVASILPGYDYKYTQARGMWNDQSSRNGIDTTYVYGEMFLPTLGNKGSTPSKP